MRFLNNISQYKDSNKYNKQHKALALIIKKQQSTLKSNSAFTIVELLVVIVVIGVLAAITAVSYAGVSQKANVAAMQQQLSNNSSLLKVYNAQYASYPTALDANYCPSAPTADTKNCLKNLDGATMTYSGSVSTFSLTISKSGANYKITDAGSIAKVITCPTGYIVVPGSPTYGTSDFCVMKYEAKYDSSTGKAVSVPEGQPWTYISQTSATTAATAACSNCHLITEAEWLTIAQNVLSVASNWSTGIVGSGYIYSGHNDNVPAKALSASTNDTDGYFGTGNTTGSNQRRTLTLTNGEVIWDLAGNVWEWTAGQTTGGQPGITGETGFAWKEYTAVTAAGMIAPNVMPSGTGLTGASAWNSTNGAGLLYSYASDSSLRGFVRGGSWGINSSAGVLTLYLNYSPSNTFSYIGWRVSSPGL